MRKNYESHEKPETLFSRRVWADGFIEVRYAFNHHEQQIGCEAADE
jgi:hypothetical protein